jgi:hypothetical protein
MSNDSHNDGDHAVECGNQQVLMHDALGNAQKMNPI